MAYPSISAMVDALGDVVLLEAYNPVTKTWIQYTFQQLPADAQAAIFLWVNQVPVVSQIK